MENNHLLRDDHEPVKAEKSTSDNRVKLKQQDLRDTHEDAKLGYIATICGLILSGVNTFVAILISLKFSATVAIPIIVFGIFSMIIFGFGYWAVWKYHKECEHAADSGDINKMEALDQSLPRLYVNVFLYLTMIIFIFFLIISIACFFFQQEAQRYVESVSKNQEKWNKIFGKNTFDQINNRIRTYLNIAGLFSFLLFLVCGFIIFTGFRLLGKYRMTQVIIQFICIIFFLLGCVFLYMGIYAGRYRDFAKVDKAMPEWVPDALLATAIISLVAAGIGYVASQLENSEYLKYFAIGASVLTLMIVVFAFGTAVYSSRFESYFDKKCNYILDYMNETYLIKYAKCEKKYLFTSNTIDNMNCPKNRIVNQWENNVGKDIEEQVETFGCLDSDCCYQAYSTIKNNIDYLALITFILFLLCAGLAAGSYYMYLRLTDTSVEREVAPKQEINLYYYLGGFVSVCVVLTAVFVSTMPAAPTPSPTTFVVVERSPESTKPYVAVDLKAEVTNYVKEEEKKNDDKAKVETSIAQDTSKCTVTNTCPKLKYTYDIVTNDGTFTLSENMNKLKVVNNKQETPQEWWLQMTGDESTLSYFINSFTFNPKCLLKQSKIRMKTVAEAVPFDTVLLQLSQNQPAAATTETAPVAETQAAATYNIDVSKLNVGDKFEIFDTVLDYSVVSETEKTRITGKVTQLTGLNTTTSLKGAKVSIKSQDFPGCEAVTVETDESGVFTTPEIPLLNGGYELKFIVNIASDNLLPHEKVITLGGSSYTNLLDLGEISLFSAALTQKITLSSVIINAIDNSFLPEATVYLYEGYYEVPNEQSTTSPAAPSFIQITQNENTDKKVSSIGKTNTEGKFQLFDINPGTYTIVAEKDGFFREVRRI